MNTDHYYTIGNTHKICQDYAVSGVVRNGAYAMVSDGCSSSPDVDTGARLLALSAKKTLLLLNGGDMNYDLFGKVTIRNLEHIGDNIPMDPHALDATLLATWVRGNEAKAYLYGDGVFVHKSSTTLRMIHVSFEPGPDDKTCPAYLSYYLDKVRLREYEDIQISKRIFDVSIYIGGQTPPLDAIEIEEFVKPFAPAIINVIVEPGDIVAVCSDGVNSFRESDSSVIEWQGCVNEFVGFKSLEGVFVQRRLAALKRQWMKEQVSHYDDIAMAAIVV
jgi:hypothetical protein